MGMYVLLLVGLLWADCHTEAVVTELSKIDRAIRKEPTYRTKAPKYCLLVFGLKANTRIWLVLDGDVLYVDRNGNGDLTEEGECIEALRTTDSQEDFVIGEVTEIDGKTKHANLDLTRYGKDRHLVIGVDFKEKYRQQAGVGLEGRLQFTDRPQDAPIIHFGGPLTQCLSRSVSLKPGEQEEIYVEVGTTGSGKGTFAAIPFEVVPKGLQPAVEIEFPAKDRGGQPDWRRYDLTARC
jgi:hypothetical protein